MATTEMNAQANPHALHSESLDYVSSACDDLPLNLPKHEPPHDLLTVFQANPIARTGPDHKEYPMVLLDLDSERQRLTESIQAVVGDRIEIAFKIATTELLGDFLSKGEGRILHFSCHGHPLYLAIEDNWGHAQALRVEKLKRWFQLGGKSVRFVFVSACNSRAAGDAFVEAGVPHVVCCKTDDEQVNNAVAIEFQKAFYRNLACGKPLQQAFVLARHEVSLNPVLCALDPSNETNKFTLLPEEACHDVPIFFAQPYVPKYHQKNAPGIAVFPPAPKPFIGRQLEMFRIIDHLKLSRLVRVSGESGIGKKAIVKTCCQYISHRRYMFQDIFWLPSKHEANNSICDCFSHLMKSFQVENCQCTNAKLSIRKILKHFRNRKSLLVFDTKSICIAVAARNFNAFLEELLEETRHVKVIVLSHPGCSAITRNIREVEVKIGALDWLETLTLFGWMCPHVAMRTYPAVRTPQELTELLASNKQLDPFGRSCNRIYDILGHGNPAKIHDQAKNMTPALYKQLIGIAQWADVGSRVALDIRAKSLTEEYECALEEERLDRAEEIQEVLSVIDLLRQVYPELSKLKAMAEATGHQYDDAISAKKLKQAQKLQKELIQVNNMIKAEKEAEVAFAVISTGDKCVAEDPFRMPGAETVDTDDRSADGRKIHTGERKRLYELRNVMDEVEMTNEAGNGIKARIDDREHSSSAEAAETEGATRYPNDFFVQHQNNPVAGARKGIVSTSMAIALKSSLSVAKESIENKGGREEADSFIAKTPETHPIVAASGYSKALVYKFITKPFKALPREQVLYQQAAVRGILASKQIGSCHKRQSEHGESLVFDIV